MEQQNGFFEGPMDNDIEAPPNNWIRQNSAGSDICFTTYFVGLVSNFVGLCLTLSDFVVLLDFVRLCRTCPIMSDDVRSCRILLDFVGLCRILSYFADLVRFSRI